MLELSIAPVDSVDVVDVVDGLDGLKGREVYSCLMCGVYGTLHYQRQEYGGPGYLVPSVPMKILPNSTAANRIGYVLRTHWQITILHES